MTSRQQEFGKRLSRRARKDEEYGLHYLQYDSLKKIVGALYNGGIADIRDEHLLDFFVVVKGETVTHEDFKRLLYDEIFRIEGLINSKATQIRNDLKDQEKLLRSMPNNPTSNAAISKSVTVIGNRFLKLEEFANVNYRAFGKLLKRHDQVMPMLLQCYTEAMELLHRQPWKRGDFADVIVRMSAIHSSLRGDVYAEKDLGSQQSFTRSTKKYWVRMEDVAKVKYIILQHLPVFLQKGATGERDDQLTNSVYFDNETLELYHGRLDKLPGAIALRIRWYGDGHPSTVFVERKTHVEPWTGGMSVKERFIIQESQVLPMLRGELDAAAEIQKMREKGKGEEEINAWEKLFTEVTSAIKSKQLTPLIRTQYMRVAFQIPFDATVRISLDTSLNMMLEEVDENAPAGDGTGVPRPGSVRAMAGASAAGAKHGSVKSKAKAAPLASGVIQEGKRNEEGEGGEGGEDEDESDSVDGEREHELTRWYRDPTLPVPDNVITHFPHAVLEVKLQLEGGAGSPQWVEDLIASGLVTEVHKFSKFIHGCATLLPACVQAVPYWTDDASLFKSIMKSGGGVLVRERKKEERRNRRATVAKVNRASMAGTTMLPPRDSVFPSISMARSPSIVRDVREMQMSLVNRGDMEAPLLDNDMWRGTSVGNRAELRERRALCPCFPPTPHDIEAGLHNHNLVGRKDKEPRKVFGVFALPDRSIALKIEPKVFFANERVFLRWINILATFAGFASLLFRFARKQDADTAAAASYGLIVMPCVIIGMLYALYAFMWRNEKLYHRSPDVIDDRAGGVVLTIFAIVFTLGYGIIYGIQEYES